MTTDKPTEKKKPHLHIRAFKKSVENQGKCKKKL